MVYAQCQVIFCAWAVGAGYGGTARAQGVAQGAVIRLKPHGRVCRRLARRGGSGGAGLWLRALQGILAIHLTPIPISSPVLPPYQNHLPSISSFARNARKSNTKKGIKNNSVRVIKR